ncbi:MAG: helix-turn-helix transcriptional regulator [Bacteroidales bacterium]|nr:helix-turn-helix transcriptional regulator [Bacteroidales bacterium]
MPYWNEKTEGVDIYFPRRLQDLMDEQCLEPKDLEFAGVVSASSVKEYLDGGRLPSLRTIIHIAEFFNVELDWLCGRGSDDWEQAEDISYDPQRDRRAPWLS